MKVKPWNNLSTEDQQALKEPLENIFFLTAHQKQFHDEQTKQQFFQRWLGIYLQRHPTHCYLLFEDQENPIGYLCACPDTNSFLKQVSDASLEIFREQFESFPAHLHINLHPSHQKKGGGQLLIKCLIDDLKRQEVKGVHIVTSPQATNRLFYNKMGFLFKMEHHWGEKELLFMGKKIIPPSP